ncbi:SpoIIE family protein phosphatase [Streptomyces tagetis]|uniref:protein-serine/threonine phosphatase n=1 Tax=Streptomyces tagetis TaxID=2820809 RepID=A0A940XPM8_9ACTN|nr:SpoIIE family protein phosphatase [Streptomyces sp. RG38]MBQ0827498.1 SpoIIE family protein phosphatase [Streptomyces sp. RG38]
MTDGVSRGAGDEPGFWQQVVEQLQVAVGIVDPTGRVLMVNPAGERLLARTEATMRDRNIHDLLHRDTDGGRIPRESCPLLRTLAEGTAASGESETCLRGDGRRVSLAWSASPLPAGGPARGMTVLFTDITKDRTARRERVAYTSALEDLAGRLTLVAEITDVLGQTLDTDEALSRLNRLLVPRLADWAAVDLLVGADQVHRVAVTGPDGRDTGQEDWRGGLPPAGEAASSPLVQVLHGGEPVLQTPSEASTAPGSPPPSPPPPPSPSPSPSPLAAVHSDFLRAVRATSAVSVPLGAPQQVVGALTLARVSPDHPFDAADLEVVADIGHRVGLVIDNARRFGRQRAIAEAMQRNLLAPLPRHGRLRPAARYQPAPAGSQVGGDWYDAFVQQDGAMALVIGDVVGHDLTAAAGMAQLHGILRSLAWDHAGSPAAVVDRLDIALPAITTVPMATLILARVEGPDTGPWTLRWSSAGHPPPLLLTPDGRARYLEAGQGLLLGAGPGRGEPRPDGTEPLPPGSTLLLYTDGLVEVPGSDLDTGLDRLRRHALALAGEPLDTMCDELLSHTPPGSTDDVALLALRLPPA